MKKKNINKTLQWQVREYLDYVWTESQNENGDEGKIID